MLLIDDDELRITTVKRRVQRAQRLVRKHVKAGTSLVDELIAERREASSMSCIVLDASALLAVLNAEAGADKLTPQLLNSATSSTVNLAEVQAKLVGRGLSPRDAWEATLSPIREAIPFTAEHARIAVSLVTQTRAR